MRYIKENKKVQTLSIQTVKDRSGGWETREPWLAWAGARGLAGPLGDGCGRASASDLHSPRCEHLPSSWGPSKVVPPALSLNPSSALQAGTFMHPWAG